MVILAKGELNGVGWRQTIWCCVITYQTFYYQYPSCFPNKKGTSIRSQYKKKKGIFLLLEGLYASFPPALCSLTHMMYTHIFPPSPPHTLHLEAIMVVAQSGGCL